MLTAHNLECVRGERRLFTALDFAVTPGTLLAAVAIGVVVVGLAPLLMARRLRRMALPGTLRLVE